MAAAEDRTAGDTAADSPAVVGIRAVDIPAWGNPAADNPAVSIRAAGTHNRPWDIRAEDTLQIKKWRK